MTTSNKQSCMPSVTQRPFIQKLARRAKFVAPVVMLLGSTSLYAAHAAEDSAAQNAILTHPNIVQLRAQVCQSYAQIDSARAGNLPQVGLRVSGGQSLTSNIKEETDTQRRRFDRKEIDAVVNINQNLFDWGVVNKTIKIAEINRDITRIDVVIETDRQAADLLSTLLRYRELEQHRVFYEDLQKELAEIAKRIEAGVNAGVLTLTDLRQIKISNLDTEVAYLQITREIDVLKTDLRDRYKLTVEQALPFLIKYERSTPEALPKMESQEVREIRKLDLQKRVADYEIDRLKAQRKPAINGIVDTYLYDISKYNDEYEVIGRVELSVPLYDGGSNKAGRREAEWRGRSVTSQRSSVIRDYNTQTERVRQSLEQIDQNLISATEQIVALEKQIEAFLAREGQTASEPLSKAALLTQHGQVLVEHASLQAERDREFLRGLFLADALGGVLKFDEKVSEC